MSIVVEHLVKKYKHREVVSDISFRVEVGEIVGFLGPNGAGKSTTLKIVTTYLSPSQGRVFVDGIDVVAHPLAVRKKVGYLPEHNPLYPDMYVGEYLGFVAGLHGLGRKKTKQRVAQMIDTIGLTREKHKKISLLSKGYRQRVGLAQALIHDPPVLILDEPTTGLDPNQILEIRDVIRRAAQHKTLILSTHIMQEVQALCDRVVILDTGKIVADQPTALLRTAADAQKLVYVEFVAEPPPRLFEALELNKIEKINPKTYRFHAKANTDPRVDIFNTAAAAKVPILTMKTEENSLEQVFRTLTRAQEKKPPPN